MFFSDRLLTAFDTPSGIPFSDVNLKTRRGHAPKWSPDSSTSEVLFIFILRRMLAMRMVATLMNLFKYFYKSEDGRRTMMILMMFMITGDNNPA